MLNKLPKSPTEFLFFFSKGFSSRLARTIDRLSALVFIICLTLFVSDRSFAQAEATFTDTSLTTGTIDYNGAPGTYTITNTFFSGGGPIKVSNPAQGGGIYFQYTGDGNWELTANFAASMTDPDLKPNLTLYGKINALVSEVDNPPGLGFGSKFSTYTFTWAGGGTAIVRDPANQLNVADGTTISSGGSFTQNGSNAIPNDELEWYVILPVQASDLTLNAVRGAKREGFRFTALFFADLQISKSVDNTTPSEGDTVEYTITATNTGGSSAATNVEITDSLPAGLTFVSAETDIGGNTALGGTYTSGTGLWEIPKIRDTETATLKIRARVNSGTAGSTITNTISDVDMDQLDLNVSSDDTSEDITVAASASPPSIDLDKDCTAPADCVSAPQTPGTELTYQIDFSNTGGSAAESLIVADIIPNDTDYKVGSAAANVGTTGLTFAIEYSDDYVASNPTAATWTYSPSSGAGGASSGYDRNVKAIRWRVTSGTLSETAPNNTGSVSFVAKIR